MSKGMSSETGKYPESPEITVTCLGISRNQVNPELEHAALPAGKPTHEVNKCANFSIGLIFQDRFLGVPG